MKEVLVTGIPRCGTTYIFRSLAGLPQGSGSPKGATLEKLPIMKAHSLAPPGSFGDPWFSKVEEHVNAGRKVIFVFGDPILAVASTIRKRFDSVHAHNCGYFGPMERRFILEKDIFHYEQMFDSWTNTKMCPVLCLRYEALESIQRFHFVEDFLRQRIDWLPLLNRETKYRNLDPHWLKMLKLTYGALHKKILDAPDVIIRNI